MVKRTFEQLAVVETPTKVTTYPVAKLKEVIRKKVSEIIYFTCEGCLYGVVSVGDILFRQENGEISVNAQFTRVYHGEYIKAKNVFKEHPNIHKIPIVERNSQKLIGDYSGYNDIYITGSDKWFIEAAVKEIAAEWKMVGVVYPCETYPWKVSIFQNVKELLQQSGVDVISIEREEYKQNAKEVEVIIFMDEDERKGCWWLLEEIPDDATCMNRVFTEFLNTNMWNRIEKKADEWLDNLQQMGLEVYNIIFQTNKSGYFDILYSEIEKVVEATKDEVTHRSFLPPSRWEDFFCEEFCEEDAEQLSKCSHIGKQRTEKGINYLQDNNHKACHIKNGIRYTDGNPADYQRTIWFYGPCLMIGAYVKDKYTIESWLQKSINEEGYKLRVVNMGAWNKHENIVRMIYKNKKLRKGDLVIFLSQDGTEKYYSKLHSIDLTKGLEKYRPSAEWFVNNYLHCNHKVNEIYAAEIYEVLKADGVLETYTEEQNGSFIELPDIDEVIGIKDYIQEYFSDFLATTYNKVGAIVMNCNPFTLGHRYLIETAAAQVDYLIIFVVQEDRSVFSFFERYHMVSEGVKDLDNVMVVPSGPYILSLNTFPEYFEKQEGEDLKRNVEADVTLFGEKIAPELNIAYRFVGEEPEDIVTRTYNDAMKRILPKRGIEVIEIPRKKVGNQWISASKVRRCLENGEVEKLVELLPKTTLDALV